MGDDNGSDHFIINGVFSYKPIYNKMHEKTVRLSHKADWIDIDFVIRSTMTKTTLNKMTITKDEIDNYVDTLINTITSAIAEKSSHQIHQKKLYWFANRNQGTESSEETPEENLAKDQNTAVQGKC